MGFLSFAQVCNYCVKIEVMIPCIRIAIAPDLGDDFILIHFLPPL